MAVMQSRPTRVMWSSPGYAYLMTGLALLSIVVSGVLGSIFSPDMVTGAQHEHMNGSFIGWIFNLVAIGMVLTAAMKGIRAKVADPAPWTMLGVGVSVVWIGALLVAVFAPVWVVGTDPEQIPIWGLFGAIAGIVITGILCNFVRTAAFEPPATSEFPSTPGGAGAMIDDPASKLRQLAQLRDSGAITEAEFQTKKTELLGRI